MRGDKVSFLESLGTKPLRFLDLKVDHWRKLHRQAQKHLEPSGLKEQSIQLARSPYGRQLLHQESSTGPSLNLESCPSRFAWATLCQDESEDFFQQSGRSQELALAGRARLLFTRSVHLPHHNLLSQVPHPHLVPGQVPGLCTPPQW